jgi:hypothetical protein
VSDAWKRLEVESNDSVELDMDQLPREVKEGVFLAIERYAATGVGNTVAYAPSGGLHIGALRTDGVEIRFHIDDTERLGPTMVLVEVFRVPADAEPGADD